MIDRISIEIRRRHIGYEGGEEEILTRNLRVNRGVDDTEASRTVHPSERQSSILESVKRRYALQLVVHNTTLRARQHGRAADPVRGTLHISQCYVLQDLARRHT